MAEAYNWAEKVYGIEPSGEFIKRSDFYAHLGRAYREVFDENGIELNQQAPGTKNVLTIGVRISNMGASVSTNKTLRVLGFTKYDTSEADLFLNNAFLPLLADYLVKDKLLWLLGGNDSFGDEIISRAIGYSNSQERKLSGSPQELDVNDALQGRVIIDALVYEFIKDKSEYFDYHRKVINHINTASQESGLTDYLRQLVFKVGKRIKKFQSFSDADYEQNPNLMLEFLQKIKIRFLKDTSTQRAEIADLPENIEGLPTLAQLRKNKEEIFTRMKQLSGEVVGAAY